MGICRTTQNTDFKVFCGKSQETFFYTQHAETFLIT